MANQTQDVELRIRATNYAKQTTDKVVDSLKEMTKAQDAQLESARKGTTTVAALEASYTKLENAAKALLSQQSLTKLYQAQSGTLTELQAKLEAARKAQQDYSNSLTPGAERTKKEEAEIKRLGRALDSVEKQFARAQNRVDSTAKRMAEFGITSGNLAATQQKIVDAVNQANAAMARQETAINNADSQAAARKAAADAIAQRQLQIRVDNQFAQAQRDLAAALAAETAAQRAANEAANNRARERQVEVDVLFAQAQRAATEEINRRTAATRAQQQALRDAADAAERMMRASVVQARGSTPVLGPQLANQIRDIQNPADAAVRSIAGIERAIGGLETRVTQIRGPVRDYRGALDDARRAQAALLTVAGQVDGYQRQLNALRASRYEFTQSRVAVNALIAEMRSGAAGADITTRLAAAQRTMQQAAANLGGLTTQARASREALRAAGVDTTNLTAAEAGLVAQAGRATTALNALTQAFQRNGAATDDNRNRLGSWFGSGRTTLSYMQRMRGELLGMAAGFVGLNAAVGLAQSSLEAYRTTQAITSRLTIANGGDARKAAEDFKYLETQADRIGFVFLRVAPAYTKFAIAMRSAGFSTQETRFSFEQIAGAAVKARLSTEELEGVMKAFEQMASKGKIQAEELRGQLGDRLPGAFQIAARAAGKTVEEYTKMMELGQVGSDQVVAIARELGKTYGIAEKGAESILTAQARFENAANRFRTSTAEGGFVQAYSAFLVKLTDLLNDGQGDVLASKLSAGFTAVVDVMAFVADNIDLLTIAVKALIAVNLIKWLLSLPALFLAVKTEVLALNGMLLVLNGRLSIASITAALTAALGAMGISTAGLTTQIGLLATALRGLALAIPIVAGAAAAYFATKGIMDNFADSNVAAAKKAIDESTKAYNNAVEARAAYDKAMNTKDEAAAKAHYDKMAKIAQQAMFKKDKAIADARDSWNPLSAEQENVMAQAQKKGAGSAPPKATEDPGDRPVDYLKKIREDLLAEDKKTDKAMKQQRLRSAKEELADRLAIIDEQFEVRRKTAKDTIKDENTLNEALKLINASSLRAQAVERLKFQNEQATKSQENGNRRIAIAKEIKDKLDAIEADIGKRDANADATEPYETRRKARIDAIGHAYDEVRNKIQKTASYAPKQAAADMARLALLTKERQLLEGQNSDREEATRLVKEYDDLQAVLKSRLEGINANFEANRITAAQQLAETNAAVREAGPGIEAAGARAMEFATSVKAMLDPVAYANIMATVGSGLAKTSVDATTAGNDLAAQQKVLNTVLQQQADTIETISTKRKLGMIDSTEEARLLNENAATFQSTIIANIDALMRLAETARNTGAISVEAFNQIAQSMGNLKLETGNAQMVLSDLDQTIVGSVTQNGTAAFEQLAGEIAKVASGAQSIGDGFKAAMGIVGQFFAQLLRDIAMAIIKQLILKAITTAIGGPVGAAAGAAGGAAGGMHRGGVVGRDRTFTRRVPMEAFANAPRYHTGGLAGFRPNEIPTILEKNEEVLTRDDPRHVLNGGGKQPGGADMGNRFVLVDDRKNVAQAMASSEGEKVTLVHLKANLPTLKQWLK